MLAQQDKEILFFISHLFSKPASSLLGVEVISYNIWLKSVLWVEILNYWIKNLEYLFM